MQAGSDAVEVDADGANEADENMTVDMASQLDGLREGAAKSQAAFAERIASSATASISGDFGAFAFRASCC